MKRILSLLVLIFMVSMAFSGVADERGAFRFEPYQGGAMGMQFIDVVVDEDAGVMSLWPNQDVSNVVLERLYWDAYMAATIIYQADALSSSQVINLKAYLYDAMPAFRVTCVNAAGLTERWYLADSGEDGSLLLLPPDEIEAAFPDFFDQFSGVEFSFSSGAGAWDTALTLTGSRFTGSYHDSEMGDAEKEYPNGTVYGCLFHGELSYLGQIGEYAFALKCESLELDEGQLPEVIEDSVRYVTSQPYGLENAELLTLYMPGCPVDSLPEELLPWLHLSDFQGDGSVLQTYVLYSPADESGFVGMPKE